MKNGEVIMYKKQLAFQKIVCLIAIIAAAVTFVYSLGMITDIYDSLYSTMRNPNDLTDTKVPGSIIYYDMQPFNKAYVGAAIALILVACTLYLTNTHVRRKYYVGNLVSTLLYSGATLGVAIWSHIQINAFAHQYMTTIDFEALEKFSKTWKTPYLDSTFLLDLHYVVLGLSILSVVLLIGNYVWKCVMMNAEKKLLNSGKEAAV